MTTFYWFKGAPGLYYLHDQPRGDGKRAREVVAKVRRESNGVYSITIQLPQAISPLGWGRIPNTAIAEAEDQVREIVPHAAFTRENFQ